MSDGFSARGKPGTAWNDPKVPGLRLRHFENKSVWYLYYRTKTAKQRNMKLADERVLTRTAARDMAKELLVRVAKGEDPAGERERLADRPTMQKLRDWHIERHAETKNKERWQSDTKGYYDKHILPHFGADKAVADVTEEEVADLHHKMRGTPYAANRCMSVLAKAFKLAENPFKWRPKNSNPVTVERYPEKKRQRFPSPDEAVRLLVAINAAWANNPWFAGGIELLCFTGARRNEIFASEREWIKDDGLHLPDSKGGERILPLSKEAREVIDLIPKVKGNKYLIAGHKRGRYMSSPKSLWAELLKSAKVKNLRMHDLRRFFASAGLSGGLTLDGVGGLLGHMDPKTTKRYAYLLTDASQAMSDVAASKVKSVMTAGGKIAQIRRKA